ncbi:hypothetical protein ACH5RR_021505, partial [Cinchona calisaya]
IKEGRAGYGIFALRSCLQVIQTGAYNEKKGVREIEECEVAKMAMIRALEKGWPSIVIHSNSKRLIGMFNQNSSMDSLVKTPLEDMFAFKDLFASCPCQVLTNDMNISCNSL